MATNGGNGTRAVGPRCVALVGPFQSGKTTLLDAILTRTGAVRRQGTIEAGNTVGDSSKEARHHRMSVELTVATTNFMGDNYTFLDCPGSVEFVHDMRAVLPAIDAAVIVCEMDEKKIPQLQLILRELEDWKIPRILFVNKIDKGNAAVHDVLNLLQPASRTKLILRQIPTFSGDIITGFVDLALERAFVYKEYAPSQVVPLEGDAADLEKTARFSMLETLAGQAGDGTTFLTDDDEVGRVAGVFKLVGQSSEKRGPAAVGETVSFAKLEKAKTGDTLSAGKQPHPPLAKLAPYPPVLAIAISAKERKDDVKLGQALNRLAEEDPSITIVHNPETHEVVLWGQGEMHLRVATERLGDRYGIAIERRTPSVGYRETIRKSIVQRGRHKKQSGGHGQYGDVVLEIKPRPRGAGFSFEEKITGGVVPRNYIPSVEEGVIDALKHGPLGFPVVDLHVALIDGSYHTVDSSDMAFRTAGRIGIVEGLPQCQPVLLEPIHLVEIVCPNEATAKINALMSSRRGQILGFDTREGWDGWDMVRAKMPEAEIGDLIVEIRSATAGAGTFTFKFDHMAELTGRTADQIIAARRAAE